MARAGLLKSCEKKASFCKSLFSEHGWGCIASAALQARSLKDLEAPPPLPRSRPSGPSSCEISTWSSSGPSPRPTMTTWSSGPTGPSTSGTSARRSRAAVTRALRCRKHSCVTANHAIFPCGNRTRYPAPQIQEIAHYTDTWEEGLSERKTTSSKNKRCVMYKYRRRRSHPPHQRDPSRRVCIGATSTSKREGSISI